MVIDGHPVGPGQPAFLAAEVGATHTGLASLLRLAEAVARAGFDALKVQVVRAEDLMAPGDETEIEFGTVGGGVGRETLYGALKRRELSAEGWRLVKERCDELGLAFIGTPSGPEMVDLLVGLKAHALKIAKGDMTHLALIEYAAQRVPALLLDGRERIQEVGRALELARTAGVDTLIVHCPSGYPAPIAGVHLAAIPALQAVFGPIVGYADHSIGSDLCLAARALGAVYLEKTLTEDRTRPQVEHAMSLEPQDLPTFFHRVRALEAALGTPRILTASRVEPAHRRGLVAARDLPRGHVLGSGDVLCRRPEAGIGADQAAAVEGLMLLRSLRAGDALRWKDLA